MKATTPPDDLGSESTYMRKKISRTPTKRFLKLIIAIGAIVGVVVMWPILKELGYQSGDDAIAAKIYDWRSQLELEKLETQNKLPKGILSAVMHQESAGDPNAQSHAGAKGLFQFMSYTAKDMGLKDRTHPEDSAKAAAKYLGQLYNRYDNNLELTLAAYNWGLGNIDQYIKPRTNGSTYERFKLSKMPAETQNYIARIKMLRTNYYLR